MGEFNELFMTFDDLYIVNYCHHSCTPLLNIMRLPKDEAFALAYKMAEQNKDTAAFYRFADFDNYYQDACKRTSYYTHDLLNSAVNLCRNTLFHLFCREVLI